MVSGIACATMHFHTGPLEKSILCRVVINQILPFHNFMFLRLLYHIFEKKARKQWISHRAHAWKLAAKESTWARKREFESSVILVILNILVIIAVIARISIFSAVIMHSFYHRFPPSWKNFDFNDWEKICLRFRSFAILSPL